MTNEEIQRQLDALENQRNLMKDAQVIHSLESDSLIANIQRSVSSMQKNVKDIMEPLNGTRTKRNSTRT